MSKEIAEALNNIASALWGVANAITPTGATAGTDAVGGTVASLTEAVMGVTKAVANVNSTIAEALFGFDASDQKAIDAKLLA